MNAGSHHNLPSPQFLTFSTPKKAKSCKRGGAGSSKAIVNPGSAFTTP